MKIRTYDGTVAEVDDELGKRLVALPGGEWSALKKQTAAEKKAEKEAAEAAQESETQE